ncbi:hypothetical protein [Haloquadratum walsbyi]|uniref:Uncharacterized protein n=1 Tax=Haloquadratum walsbyi J07HQW2 TaxID=1238425 RepID=U1NA96_9EURY|nr:hypothetical protein [Haloquadratum walsbyi]ERG93750.1 MAG: hypothetical protein J07HQW2_00184 [Haloquadratum walsbyi J07HQW2]
MLDVNDVDDRVQALFRAGAFAAILTAGTWVFTDRSLISAAVPFFLIVAWRVSEAFLQPYDIPSGIDGIGIGLLLTVISGSWLIVGTPRPWFPVIALVCGTWFTTDGYKTYRDGPPGHSAHSYFEHTDSGIEAIQRVQRAGRIIRAVRECPQTPPEVAADVGISEKEATIALESLTEHGMIEQVGCQKRDNVTDEIGEIDGSDSTTHRGSIITAETETHADTSEPGDAERNKSPSSETQTQTQTADTAIHRA